MNKQRAISVTKSATISLVLIGLGFALGALLFSNPRDNEESKEIRSGPRGLINPLLACEVGGETIAARKQNFGRELGEIIGDIKQRHQLADASVYFRDMNNGPVVSINEQARFIPASLLKVPVLMAYLAQAEQVAHFLDAQILYEEKLSEKVQIISPVSDLEFNKRYSARELLQQMIIASDNNALLSLLPTVPMKQLVALYTLLDIPAEILDDPTATITVKQYSAFFRILFNASYLSPRASEQALAILTKTQFNNGIVAGIPNNKEILVAHKFGERKIGDGLQQLHDCGIVYYPGHPYLLCVMTRGRQIDALAKSIQEISQFVYEKIDSQYGR